MEDKEGEEEAEKSHPPKVTKVTSSRAKNRPGAQKAHLKTTPLVPKPAHPGVQGREAEGEGEGGQKGLDMEKLKSILTGFGEYPAKYRSVNCCGVNININLTCTHAHTHTRTYTHTPTHAHTQHTHTHATHTTHTHKHTHKHTHTHTQHTHTHTHKDVHLAQPATAP